MFDFGRIARTPFESPEVNHTSLNSKVNQMSFPLPPKLAEVQYLLRIDLGHRASHMHLLSYMHIDEH